MIHGGQFLGPIRFGLRDGGLALGATGVVVRNSTFHLNGLGQAFPTACGGAAVGSASRCPSEASSAQSTFTAPSSFAASAAAAEAESCVIDCTDFADPEQEHRAFVITGDGKTLAEGIGETIRAAQIFKFFAGETLRNAGDKLASVRPGVEVYIEREAVGIVGLITPWNFPIAIPAWKIAPALCYGNAVVIKPADLVPGCAWEIAMAGGYTA